MTRTAPARASVRGHGRRLLLGAARELFAERGYKGTSTRDIAERAGVTEPMLFRHFGTKVNLFQEAAVQPFADFMQRYVDDHRRGEHGGVPPDEVARHFYGGLFTELRAERELLISLLVAHEFGETVEDISAQIATSFGQVMELFDEVVENEAAARRFDGFDLQATVRIMFGMVLSVALHGDWLTQDDAVSEDRMLDAMAALTVRGLRVPMGE